MKTLATILGNFAKLGLQPGRAWLAEMLEAVNCALLLPAGQRGRPNSPDSGNESIAGQGSLQSDGVQEETATIEGEAGGASWGASNSAGCLQSLAMLLGAVLRLSSEDASTRSSKGNGHSLRGSEDFEDDAARSEEKVVAEELRFWRALLPLLDAAKGELQEMSAHNLSGESVAVLAWVLAKLHSDHLRWQQLPDVASAVASLGIAVAAAAGACAPRFTSSQLTRVVRGLSGQARRGRPILRPLVSALCARATLLARVDQLSAAQAAQLVTCLDGAGCRLQRSWVCEMVDHVARRLATQDRQPELAWAAEGDNSGHDEHLMHHAPAHALEWRLLRRAMLSYDVVVGESRLRASD